MDHNLIPRNWKSELFSGQCMVLVERKPILNNYDCSMFEEGCPNTWYFSDEMYKCKYESLKYELDNSLHRMNILLWVNWIVLNCHWMLTECSLKSGFQELFNDLLVSIQSHCMLLYSRHILVTIQSFFLIFRKKKFQTSLGLRRQYV